MRNARKELADLKAVAHRSLLPAGTRRSPFPVQAPRYARLQTRAYDLNHESPRLIQKHAAPRMHFTHCIP